MSVTGLQPVHHQRTASAADNTAALPAPAAFITGCFELVIVVSTIALTIRYKGMSRREQLLKQQAEAAAADNKA